MIFYFIVRRKNMDKAVLSAWCIFFALIHSSKGIGSTNNSIHSISSKGGRSFVFESLLPVVRTFPSLHTPTTTVSPFIKNLMASNMTKSQMVNAIWREFQKTLDTRIDKVAEKILPRPLKLNSDSKITPECAQGIKELVQGIKAQKTWAFRMVDAAGRLPSGILDGTFASLGSYDECLAITNSKNEDEMQLKGQYCDVATIPILPNKPDRVQFINPVLDVSNFSAEDSVLFDIMANSNAFYFHPLRRGLCVPSSCSIEDTQLLASSSLKNMPFSVKVLKCVVKESFQMSTLQITCLTIILLFLVVAVIGTIIDVYYSSLNSDVNEQEMSTLLPDRSRENVLVDALKCFSIERNWSELFDTNQSKEYFGALDGLKVLAICWVVLGHIYGMYSALVTGRMKNLKNSFENNIFMCLIYTSLHNVEIFFVIGAFLVAYLGLKSLSKNNGRLDIIQYYMHRIWRLMPSIVGVLLMVFLLPLLGSGPFFDDVIGKEVEHCKKYWWQVLLIPINGWENYEDMCLRHTWYISTDLLYFFISPVILISLYRWPYVGLLLLLKLTLVSICIVGSLTHIHDFYPVVLMSTPNQKFMYKMFNLIQMRPYTHLGPYCVGLALGYLVFHYRNSEIKAIYQVMGWLATLLCMLTIQFIGFDWNRGILPPKAFEVPYAALHRTCYSMALAWIIYMCITGRGGFVNAFLSHSLFVPLGRLTLSAYITHFFVLWVRISNVRRVQPFQHITVIYEFVAHLVFIFCLSIIFYLVFEAPFIKLEGLVFGRKRKRVESKVSMRNIKNKDNCLESTSFNE